ncbi:MAG: hypothetical protein HY223_00015 [Thaumarchaeota archaeon]|nr:hypothetical protein [Nitrososphaerota archaeon]
MSASPQTKVYGQQTSNPPATTQPYVTFTNIKVDANPVPNKPFKVSVSVTTASPSSNLILSLTVPTGISIASAAFPTLQYTLNQNERMATWTLLASKAGVYSITANAYSSVPYEVDTFNVSIPVGAINSLVVTGIDVPGSIYPNDNFTVGIKLKNAGIVRDENVRAQITVPAGLQLLDTVSSPSTSLNASKETEFFWKIKAQNTGSYLISFDYSSLNSGDNSIQANVNVGSIGVSDVSISKILLGGSDAMDNHVGPGDKNVPLVVNVFNDGTEPLFNIVGTLDLGKPFSSGQESSTSGYISSKIFRVGQLGVGKDVNMTYNVDVLNSIEPTTYLNKLKISFYDGKQQHEKTLDIPVSISNGVLLSIIAHPAHIFANTVTPVTIDIKNIGNIAVHNLQITSTTGNLYTAVDTPVWVGDVGTQITKETVLKVVSANDINAQYPIPIVIQYDANGQTYTSSYQVAAQASTTPDYQIPAVTVTPNPSYPGDIQKRIDVQILNAGLSDANNVTASLILPKGFDPTWGNSTSAYLGRIKASNVATPSFYFNIGNNVTSGNYPFTLLIKDVNGIKPLNLNFIVGQKALFQVISLDDSQLYPGATNALFYVTLKNIGTYTAQTMTTKLLAGNTIPGVKSSDITAVGNVENLGSALAGQVITTTFIVNIDPTATSGDKQASVEIDWTQSNSTSFTQTLVLPYHLANGPSYLLYYYSVPWTYVIIAIGLAIALYIFIKQRKARIKSIESSWPAELNLPSGVTDSPQLRVMENETISERKAITDDMVEIPTVKDEIPTVKDEIPSTNLKNETRTKSGNASRKTSKEDDVFLDITEDDLAKIVKRFYSGLNGSRNAFGLDKNQNELFRVPVGKLIEELNSHNNIKFLILDGSLTKPLIDSAKRKGVKYVVAKFRNNVMELDGMTIKTFAGLGIS